MHCVKQQHHCSLFSFHMLFCVCVCLFDLNSVARFILTQWFTHRHSHCGNEIISFEWNVFRRRRSHCYRTSFVYATINITSMRELSCIECRVSNDSIALKVYRLFSQTHSYTYKKICSPIHCFKADEKKCRHSKLSTSFMCRCFHRRRRPRQPKWMLVHLMVVISTSTGTI